MLSYFPQLWASINIRPEDFQRRPQSAALPDVPVPDSDPIVKPTNLTLGFEITPTQATVMFQSYREGNTCKLTFPAVRLPLDPRVIRQAQVRVFAGVIDPAIMGESQTGMSGENRPILVPQMNLETGESNELFRGFIDDWRLINGEDGSYIEINCRDVTGFFIDASLPVEALERIPKDLPIDDVIKLLIEGEAASVLPGASIDDRLEDLQVIDINGSFNLTRSKITSNTGRQARVAASLAEAIATNDSGAIDSLIAEQARLSAKQTQLQLQFTEQAAARTEAASAKVALGPLGLARLGLSGSRGIRVVNNTGEPLPPIGDIKGAEWFDSKGSIKKSKSRGTAAKMSYWDFITDLCVGSGYICYIRTPKTQPVPIANTLIDISPNAELVIDHPRTYYPDISDEPRRFIYGYNVNRIELARDYNAATLPKAIVVSAIAAESGKTVTYRHPPLPPKQRKSNRATIDIQGTGDREDVDRYILKDRVPEGSIQATLKRHAESIYDQLFRAELTVSIETSVLNAFDTDNPALADMLQLRPADPIEVQIAGQTVEKDETSAITGMGQFRALGNIERRLRLIELGMDPLLANAIGAAEESPFFQRVFRVQSVQVDWDSETGFNFNVEAINYLDVTAEGGVSP